MCGFASVSLILFHSSTSLFLYEYKPRLSLFSVIQFDVRDGDSLRISFTVEKIFFLLSWVFVIPNKFEKMSYFVQINLFIPIDKKKKQNKFQSHIWVELSDGSSILEALGCILS